MNFLDNVLYVYEYIADYGQMTWSKAVDRTSDEFGIPIPETDRMMAFMVYEQMLKETEMPHPIEYLPPMRGVEAVKNAYVLIEPEMVERYPLFFGYYAESILKRKQDKEDERLRREDAKRLETINALKRQVAGTRFTIRKTKIEIENGRERILLGYDLSTTSRTLVEKEQILDRALARLERLTSRLEELDKQ